MDKRLDAREVIKYLTEGTGRVLESQYAHTKRRWSKLKLKRKDPKYGSHSRHLSDSRDGMSWLKYQPNEEWFMDNYLVGYYIIKTLDENKNEIAIRFEVALNDDCNYLSPGKSNKKSREYYFKFLKERENQLKEILIGNENLDFIDASLEPGDQRDTPTNIQKKEGTVLVLDKDNQPRKIEDIVLEIECKLNDLYDTINETITDSFKDRGEKMKNDIIELLEENKQVILTGAPGTGKTYLARQIAADMIGTNLDDLENNDQFKFVQFHPSYDYTDFIEGLRPEKHNGNNIGFKRQDGIFKEFCKKAKEKEKNEDGTLKEKFVFVIDEINRGDISKIFGELFYAIDPGYRGVKGKVNTQYQNLVDDQDPFKSGFYVPENVYIIGTMNDIDRSVESMDFAIRRRFIWYAIEPTKTQEPILSNATYKEEIKNLMEAVNLEIVHTDGLGEAFQLGASYFRVKANENGAEPKWEDYKGKIWKYRVKPLLKEYLRGMPNEEDPLKELEKAWNNPDETLKKYNGGDVKTN